MGATIRDARDGELVELRPDEVETFREHAAELLLEWRIEFADVFGE